MNDDDFQKIWENHEKEYLKSKGWQELTYDITGEETWYLPFNMRENCPPLAKSQHYWDRGEALELQNFLDKII